MFYGQSGSLHRVPGQLNVVPQLSFFPVAKLIFRSGSSTFAAPFVSTEVKHQLHSFVHMKFKAVVRLINQNIFLTQNVVLRRGSESRTHCAMVLSLHLFDCGVDGHTVADQYEIA